MTKLKKVNSVTYATNRNFTMISNELLLNPNISALSKTLYAIIRSRPEYWDLQMEWLVKHLKESRNTIYKSMRELRTLGYLSMHRLTDSFGRKTGGIEYRVYDDPSENQHRSTKICHDGIETINQPQKTVVPKNGNTVFCHSYKDYKELSNIKRLRHETAFSILEKWPKEKIEEQEVVVVLDFFKSLRESINSETPKSLFIDTDLLNAVALSVARLKKRKNSYIHDAKKYAQGIVRNIVSKGSMEEQATSAANLVDDFFVIESRFKAILNTFTPPVPFQPRQEFFENQTLEVDIVMNKPIKSFSCYETDFNLLPDSVKNEYLEKAKSDLDQSQEMQELIQCQKSIFQREGARINFVNLSVKNRAIQLLRECHELKK